MFLRFYSLRRQLTPYEIYLYLQKMKKPMGYPNVLKRVKRLEELGILERLDAGRRGAIPYRLTTRGLLERLLLGGNKIDITILLDHKKNTLLQSILYRYFEEDTIKELRRNEYSKARECFGDYLKDCCETILNFIESYRKNLPDYKIFEEAGSIGLEGRIQYWVENLIHLIVNLSVDDKFPEARLRSDIRFTSLLKNMIDRFNLRCRRFI